MSDPKPLPRQEDASALATGRRLAVLGSPIAHSLSPTLQAVAYRLLDLPFEYGRAEVPGGSLASFVAALDESWLGLSLTMPLKREVIPLLSTASPLVRQLGVANTVVTRWTADGLKLDGYNTDVDGIVRAVAPWRPEGSRGGAAGGSASVSAGGSASVSAGGPAAASAGGSGAASAGGPASLGGSGAASPGSPPERTAILGGGATAASALAASAALGLTSATLFLRDTAKAAELLPLAADLGLTVDVAGLSSVGNSGSWDLVISTLPGVADVGRLTPDSAASVLLDVAYDPWPSPLATAWEEQGGATVSGLDMLVEQAIGQIRLFTGRAQDEELDDEGSIRAAMRQEVGLDAAGGRR